MPGPDASGPDPGPDPAERRRAREAATIVRRLQDDPDDAAAQQDLTRFLARGEAERSTYARMTRALAAARQGMRRKRAPKAAALFGALLVVAAAAFGFEPLRLHALADSVTGRQPQPLLLASGDAASLDAGTALADASDGAERRVTLLAGAAYFDVGQDGRRFVVEAGGLSVDALGTGFEVAWLGDGVLVAVAEGRVAVQAGGQVWQLMPGDRLHWSGDAAPVIDAVAVTAIAAWRDDRLQADGMTLGQVASVIDRRVAGPILVYDSALAGTEVSGGLDLSRPLDALRTLAASADASVTSVSPLVTIVLP